jgi:transcription factor TGA
MLGGKKNRGEDINSRNQTRFADLGELHQPAPVFPHDDAVDLSSSIHYLLFLSLAVLVY